MENKINLNRFALTKDRTRYLPGGELTEAVEIAIALDKPLLITGEPGTGKTQLAHWLAEQLAQQTIGMDGAFRSKPFIFDTKSTSVASDLFYSYDAVSHFGKIQRIPQTKQLSKEEEDLILRQYIELRPMGLAIAQTHGTNFDDLRGIRNYYSSKKEEIKETAERKDDKLKHDAPLEEAPMSSIVLIDEIDKAPREFPNDLLNEMDNYQFEIKELNKTIKRAKNDCRIVVILTSNDEKTLPNAFLRRCVFYHIEFPEGKRLLDIAKLKLSIPPDSQGFDNSITEAINHFELLRDKVVNKKPSTAEFLDWINLLYHLKDENNDSLLNGEGGPLHPSARSARFDGVLTKTQPDIEATRM
ncbi:AAA family ATPase [Mucilaginibacter kameinonensis]|uniref:AAA family ATPase n=1 Tax=Mucilaginibacter kameinonensis TaxID=452286 RepID=UPI000EF79649|nr:MoxR family ATPase [Mucilaginibacter kameinonensis]